MDITKISVATEKLIGRGFFRGVAKDLITPYTACGMIKSVFKGIVDGFSEYNSKDSYKNPSNAAYIIVHAYMEFLSEYHDYDKLMFFTDIALREADAGNLPDNLEGIMSWCYEFYKPVVADDAHMSEMLVVVTNESYDGFIEIVGGYF